MYNQDIQYIVMLLLLATLILGLVFQDGLRLRVYRRRLGRARKRLAVLEGLVRNNPNVYLDNGGNVRLLIETRHAAFFRKFAAVTRNYSGNNAAAARLESLATAMELSARDDGMSSVLHEKLEGYIQCKDIMLPAFLKGYSPRYGVTEEEYAAFVKELGEFNETVHGWVEEDRKRLGNRLHRRIINL